jgi:hypothetical protein
VTRPVLPVCTTRVTTLLVAAALAWPLPSGDPLAAEAGVGTGLVSVGVGEPVSGGDEVGAVGVGVVGVGLGDVAVGVALPVGVGVGVDEQVALGVAPWAAFGPAVPPCPLGPAEAAELPGGKTAPEGLFAEPVCRPWLLIAPSLLIWVAPPDRAAFTA